MLQLHRAECTVAGSHVRVEVKSRLLEYLRPVSCFMRYEPRNIMKLPNHITAFDVKHSLVPGTESYTVYNRTNILQRQTAGEEGFIDGEKKEKKNGEELRVEQMLQQPERLWQSAEASETTHCRDQGGRSKAVQQRHRYRVRRGRCSRRRVSEFPPRENSS